jgi:hypothetical protein
MALLAIVTAGAATSSAVAASPTSVSCAIEVEPVWSGHPVRFAIQTVGERQYVAYYDAERRMSVAARDLGSTQWTIARLPSKLGWDSHNGLAMAVDIGGHIHLAGNMHGDPLVYFRTAAPHDITTFVRSRMVGDRERRVSYPNFFAGPDSELYFEYRHGSSGSGLRLFNRLERQSGRWRRLHDQPLIDGGDEMSAYPVGPTLGPDGRFHLVWMWRDTPSGATNHDLSYARSRDLVHWQDARGRSIDLPIRPATPGVVVDAVQSGGGLAGIAFGLGWDTRQRPTINYTRYDAAGRSQAYNARWEDDGWRIYQTSDWSYRWQLDRTGTLPMEIVVQPIRSDDEGRMVQWFEHLEAGRGGWVLDEDRLVPVSRLEVTRWSEEVRRPESPFPGMVVHPFVHDQRGEHFLRWETLPTNRDRPRKPPLPGPSMLRVCRVDAAERQE